jgi:hypothetical protein
MTFVSKIQVVTKLGFTAGTISKTDSGETGCQMALMYELSIRGALYNLWHCIKVGKMLFAILTELCVWGRHTVSGNLLSNRETILQKYYKCHLQS